VNSGIEGKLRFQNVIAASCPPLRRRLVPEAASQAKGDASGAVVIDNPPNITDMNVPHVFNLR
jgi:hypothetical protein